MFKKLDPQSRFELNTFKLAAESIPGPTHTDIKTLPSETDAPYSVGDRCTRGRLAAFGSVLVQVVYFVGLVILTVLCSVLLLAWIPTVCLPRPVQHLLHPRPITVITPDLSLSGTPFTLVKFNGVYAPINYALNQCGAEVMADLTLTQGAKDSFFSASTRDSSTGFSDALAAETNQTTAAPEWALDGSTEAPCWQFDGSRAQLGFALSRRLNISFVSIDHDCIDQPQTAPRTIIVWGLIDGRKAMKQYEDQVSLRLRLLSHLPSDFQYPEPPSYSYMPLAIVQYNPYLLSTHQHSFVFREAHLLGIRIGIVVFQVLDNWGGPVTQLCHVGVYGSPVD